MANAFAIMGIVMAIFAVLACDFYGKRDHSNFGSFTRAYFSMFQVPSSVFLPSPLLASLSQFPSLGFNKQL